jgi:glycosyltransferase involved in cell wall biosynthesis
MIGPIEARTLGPTPLVSVIIPIFNCEQYLPEAIASIRSQRFDDFELILLDDGSADGAVEIGRHAAEEDARVNCAQGDHRGVVYQRNADPRRQLGTEAARQVQTRYTVDQQAPKLLASIKRCTQAR